MLSGPINFVASFGLVPIFEWEQVEIEVPHDTSPPPATAVSNSLDPTAQSCDTSDDKNDSKQFEMRLVFKGFGWRPQFEIATYPRPSWMDGFASGAEAASDPLSREEEARRAEQNKPKPRPHLPAHQPETAAPPNPHDLGQADQSVPSGSTGSQGSE